MLEEVIVETKYWIKRKSEWIRYTMGLRHLYSTCIPDWHRKKHCFSARECTGCLNAVGTRATQALNFCLCSDTVLAVLSSLALCSSMCLVAIWDASIPLPLSPCSGRVPRAQGGNAPCQILQEPQLSFMTQAPAGWVGSCPKQLFCLQTLRSQCSF